MSLRAAPMTITKAKAFVAQLHRHHRPPVSGLFALGVGEGDRVVGVAIVGRPSARRLDDGRTAEITRVCTDGTRNACSFLYGLARRVLGILGYRRVVTYTLPEESGASLRGAGWTCAGSCGGGVLVKGFKTSYGQAPDGGEVEVGGIALVILLAHGDARRVPLRDGVASCCVTSPPYFGLRDYGTARWIGGDTACEHVRTKRGEHSTIDGGGYQSREIYPRACALCGARREDPQIGLEPTPDEFVAALVVVFREVRRVLRNDGTLWLNLGDTYAGSGRGIGDTKSSNKGNSASRGVGHDLHDNRVEAGAIGRHWTAPPSGLKCKDLIGIPWRVALALQADGWYLRAEVIWSKPNSMPESVEDRPTRSHEQIFLMSKSSRYYYDAEAVAEPQEENERSRRLREQREGLATTYDLRRDEPHGQVRPGASGCARSVAARQALAVKGTKTIPTQPFPDAHFATFPEDLVRPCVLAGAPVGGLVLDPFSGSGTTCRVALDLGRRGVGLDLNREYLAMARRRCAGVTPQLPGVPA